MGSLTPEEQKKIKKKYKVIAFYVCDHCHLPILDAPLVDVKGGYHSWPKTLPQGCRHFMSRQPKLTYHTKPCGIELFSKKGRKEKFDLDVVKAADRILKRISKKQPKGYWTKERIFKRYKELIPVKVIKKALSLLRKEKKVKKRKGGYCVR
jgi:hypothetical protein